jgi:hypothetical protein
MPFVIAGAITSMLFPPVPGYCLQIAALCLLVLQQCRAQVASFVFRAISRFECQKNHAGEKTCELAWGISALPLSAGSDGDTVTVADTLFTVCPWWDGPYARADLEQKS